MERVQRSGFGRRVELLDQPVEGGFELRAGFRSTIVSQLGCLRNIAAGSSASPALISVATARGITGDETSFGTKSK
jgi:hypothetical protein